MKRLRFGRYEFDPTTRELCREGAVVHLAAQPAQVLACLLERPGETVTRDQLRHAVWRGETFVDFERGLNFCISQVRSALRDDAAEPTYIQTVPKQGYRFIAPVTPPVLPQCSEKTPIATRRGYSSAVVFVVCLLGVAMAGMLWMKHRVAVRSSSRPVVAVVRFDNETGDPALTHFSDALSDNLVEQLTTQNDGEFGIVGNASILRGPRDQRDLQRIGEALRAKYVVLGQVQRLDTHMRILAHLIRLPEQTHIWVMRIDGGTGALDVFAAEAAQKIAVKFGVKLAEDAESPLPTFGTH